jgi:outer membrane autotransporter protein
MTRKSFRRRPPGHGMSMAALLAGLATVSVLRSGPVWAGDGGAGGAGSLGKAISGAGGTDGDASSANGQNSGTNGGGGNGGGGGGATNVTTGFGGAGGGDSTTSGVTASGSAGESGVSNVTGAVVGGAGAPGTLVGSVANGGGGGGVGVTTGSDVTVQSGGSAIGGAGGGSGGSGGGGGGGAGVFSSAGVTVGTGALVTGGAGGLGGFAEGGGGGGGIAVVLDNGGTLTNSGVVTGGMGGNADGPSIPGLGQGGLGGVGVWLSDGGTVINNTGATISGGAPATVSSTSFSPPTGGVGIEGGNVSIVNAGAIAGGSGADAVQFTGGVNSLEIDAGSTITGNVVAFSTADTLKLGGNTNDFFIVSQIGPTAQYQGFGIYEKTGASTWTLIGATTAVTPWTLTAGTLAITSDSSLGDSAGALTFDGGTLQTRDDITMDRATTLAAAGGTIDTQTGTTLTQQGQISGSGSLTKISDGTLTLTANNTYTGSTTIAAGTLALAGTGGIAASSGVSDDGIFDIAATTAGASIKSLSGGGMVNLGTQTLTMTAAADTFGGVIQGTGGLTLAGGTETVTGASTYTGDTTISAGTLVVGDAAHANASIGSGLTTIAAGATFGGYGSVAGSVTNAGTIAVADTLPAFSATGMGTLRIGGNYTGTNGQLLLNTALNQGTTPPQSDQLVVGGNASGTTGIVLHASGLGAPTTGDGVNLVQVGGQSAANSFHLSAPIQGGAYQYLLYQGGAASANDWYLRSVLEAQGTGSPAQGATSPTPASGSAPAGATAFRPGVVGYSMTPSLNVDYGFTMLGRLSERVGDVASLENAQPGNTNGVWGRIGGQNLDANSTERFSADEHTFFAEFGKDWTLGRGTTGGSTHAGVTVNFGSSSATFDDSMRSLNPQLTNSTGSVETQAQSVGGYWTRYLPDGTYIDGVGQLTHYRNQYGDVYGDGASQNGFGSAMSGEVGKPFALGSTSIAIEPQAQLLYEYLHLNGFDDAVSPVSGNTTNALRGRIGLRLFRANLESDSKTGTATPYFTADVLHDFFSSGQTNVGGTSFDDGLSKTRYELGVGVTTSMGKSSELYANLKYVRNLGGEYERNVFGQAGYRYSW